MGHLGTSDTGHSLNLEEIHCVFGAAQSIVAVSGTGTSPCTIA